MKKNKAQIIIPLFLIFFILQGFTSEASLQKKDKKLTFEQAFMKAEPRILKPLSKILSWMDNEHFLLIEESKLYKVNAKTGKKTVFFDSDKIPVKIFGAHRRVIFTRDFQGLVYSLKGDLYFYSRIDDSIKRLTDTAGVEKNPLLSPNGKYVAYTRNHNLYTLDIESGLEYQLTSDGSDTVYNGWNSWVYFEEIFDRDYRAFWWSPDSTRVAFLRFNDSPVPTFPIVSSIETHTRLELERYPKSGDANPYIRLGIVSATGGKVVWVNVDEKADHYIAWPFWFPDSSKLTFQWMNRDQDQIKIYAVNPETGKKKEIYTEKQSSWVEFFKDLYFFKNGSGFLLRSDVDGWAHLYYYDLTGNLKKRLTKGGWSVTSISCVDEENARVFFQARKGRTTETHLFRVKLDGTGLKQITQAAGTHRATVSPGGDYFIDRFSSIDTPEKLDLRRTDGTYIRNISQSKTPLMEDYILGKKELFSIPTEDGWVLPACWILPVDFDESKKYPVIFSIYSGPGSIRVTNSFPSLSNLYMVQEGIIIFSVDHRGSGHFGKKGVSLMHRRLGKWEMHDLIEAARWVRKKTFIDKEKIGITGGSYGGYTTCMALTYGAEYFTHGYARSSVTSWELYDTVYTERYMDRPSENKEGYKFSSVLTHADKLKGVLFLSHGDMDDNVHLQNTVQLISKLMNVGRKFEFMLYPDQKHGYRGKKREYSNRHYVDFWFKHFLNR